MTHYLIGCIKLNFGPKVFFKISVIHHKQEVN